MTEIMDRLVEPALTQDEAPNDAVIRVRGIVKRFGRQVAL